MFFKKVLKSKNCSKYEEEKYDRSFIKLNIFKHNIMKGI